MLNGGRGWQSRMDSGELFCCCCSAQNKRTFFWFSAAFGWLMITSIVGVQSSHQLLSYSVLSEHVGCRHCRLQTHGYKKYDYVVIQRSFIHLPRVQFALSSGEERERPRRHIKWLVMIWVMKTKSEKREAEAQGGWGWCRSVWRAVEGF